MPRSNWKPIAPDDLPDELADIAIYTHYLAEYYSINLDAAITEKIEKNGKKYPASGKKKK